MDDSHPSPTLNSEKILKNGRSGGFKTTIVSYMYLQIKDKDSGSDTNNRVEPTSDELKLFVCQNKRSYLNQPT